MCDHDNSKCWRKNSERAPTISLRECYCTVHQYCQAMELSRSPSATCCCCCNARLSSADEDFIRSTPEYQSIEREKDLLGRKALPDRDVPPDGSGPVRA
jgi:hypothetical protein